MCVLEQAGSIQAIGAGVQLAANATRVLRHYGLMPQLEQVGVRSLGTWYKDLRTDEMLHRSEAGDWGEATYGAPYMFVHRKDLQAMLLQALPPGWVRTGAQVQRVQDEGGHASVALADGTRLTADLVIGADGLNSRTREAVVPGIAPEFSGVVTWRALIAAQKLRAAGIELEAACHDWMGPDRIVAVYWCAGGRLLNLLAAIPAAEPTPESWTTSDASGLLERSFADAHPRVKAILDCIDTPFVTGIFDRPPLQTFHRGRIVLLGDAAHPFVPYLSNGAAQAIEDGHVLATVLTRAERGELPLQDALAEYEQRRRARVNAVHRLSRESLHTHHLADAAAIEQRNARYRNAQNADPKGSRLREWLWGYDVIADTARPLDAGIAAARQIERLPVA